MLSKYIQKPYIRVNIYIYEFGPNNFVIYEKEYPEETHAGTEWVFVCGHCKRIAINQMGFFPACTVCGETVFFYFFLCTRQNLINVYRR